MLLEYTAEMRTAPVINQRSHMHGTSTLVMPHNALHGIARVCAIALMLSHNACMILWLDVTTVAASGTPMPSHWDPTIASTLITSASATCYIIRMADLWLLWCRRMPCLQACTEAGRMGSLAASVIHFINPSKIVASFMHCCVFNASFMHCCIALGLRCVFVLGHHLRRGYRTDTGILGIHFCAD
jgi:hypothetical protein